MSNYFKLQNGSDVRGVALEGVEGESVNLTYKETYYLAISFANWLAGKLNRPVETLKIAVGCDSSLALNPSKRHFQRFGQDRSNTCRLRHHFNPVNLHEHPVRRYQQRRRYHDYGKPPAFQQERHEVLHKRRRFEQRGHQSTHYRHRRFHHIHRKP